MTDLLKQVAEIIRSHMTGCNTADGSVCLSSPCRCSEDAAQDAISAVLEEAMRQHPAMCPAPIKEYRMGFEDGVEEYRKAIRALRCPTEGVRVMELKPCPFCGYKEPHIYNDRERTYAVCGWCFAKGPETLKFLDDEAEPDESWNRRASNDAG